MTTGKSNKTLLGMPSDLQAVLQKLKDEEAARAGQAPPPPSAAGPQAAQHTPPPLPAALQPNALNRTLIGMRPVAPPSSASPQPSAAIPAVKAIAPVQVGAASAPSSFAHTPAAASEPIATTRLVGLDVDAAWNDTPDFSSAADAAPRLTLSQEEPRAPRPTSPVRVRAPKRWPALSLIGLAVVAFGGVVLLRAPQLLPQPLAAILGAGRTTPVAASAKAPAPTAPELPTSAHAPEQPAATALNAGSTAPPAAPGVTGHAAQLEKEAIDLLIANDYTGASKAYEQLRTQLPERREYPIMIQLLARSGAAASCGKPGQEPCATP